MVLALAKGKTYIRKFDVPFKDADEGGRAA